MNMMSKLRQYARVGLTVLLVAQVFFSYAAVPELAQAQLNTNSPPINVPTYKGVDQSIAAYLCVPDDSNKGTALFNCIGKVYRFGIAFGAIALVFFIVFAGYLYITGGETGKQRGKSMFTTALTGMVIILSSYVLLRFINPDLVKIKPIQPPIFTAGNLPSCAEVGFGVNCVLPSGQINIGGGEQGQCTVANLSACTAWNVGDAVKICTLESKGDTGIEGKSDPCLSVRDSRGNVIPGTDGFAISYGLFQIVPSTAGANGYSECSGVLNYGGVSDCPVPIATTSGGTKYCPKRKCTAPKGIDALRTCVAAIKADKTKQIQAACSIYTKACAAGKGPFSDWTTKEQLSAPSCTKS